MSATPHTSYKTILEFTISFMCTQIISVVAKIIPRNRGKQTPELRIDSRLLKTISFMSTKIRRPRGTRGSEACRAVWRGSGVRKRSRKSLLSRPRDPPASPSPIAHLRLDRPPKLVLTLRPNPFFASREDAGRSPRSPPRTSRRPIKLSRPPGGQISPPGGRRGFENALPKP